MTLKEELIYKGRINEGDYGENSYALRIGDDEPIAYILEHKIQGKLVTVRYWISDTEKPKQELQEHFLKTLIGAVEANYNDQYSEYTGYLYTDADLNIGGHDFLTELESYIDKFIWLEIDVFE